MSASTAEEEPGGRTKLSDAGRGVVDATQVDRLSQDDGQSESAHTNGSTSANATADTCDLMSGPAADTEPVSGSDARLDWLQAQFQQGQKYAQYAKAGRETENPWRRDSAEFTAWEQGFRGEAFDPGARILREATSDKSPARTPKKVTPAGDSEIRSAGSKTKSLF